MLIVTDKPCTAGASSPDGLTGPHVRLWPYVPGAYGRDALYRVWRAMEADGATRQAFWDETDPTTGADLATFIRLFDGVPSKLLLMIERANVLVGCFWLSDIRPGHQAFASMWMDKAARGRWTHEAAQLALGYSLATFQLQQLWALTPWPHAGTLCVRMGFRLVASLPEFCQRGVDRLPVSVYRLTKEHYYGLDIS